MLAQLTVKIGNAKNTTVSNKFLVFDNGDNCKKVNVVLYKYTDSNCSINCNTTCTQYTRDFLSVVCLWELKHKGKQSLNGKPSKCLWLLARMYTPRNE